MNNPKNSHIFMFTLMIFLLFINNAIVFILQLIFPSILKVEYIWIYQSICAIFCFICPIILYAYVKKVNLKDLIPLKSLSFKNFFLIILIGFSVQPLLELIASITNIFYKDEISDVIYQFTNLEYAKSLFAIAIVPSITEELAFRGVILTNYKKTPVLTGVLISSFYFGIMHLTITQLFYSMIAGILFAFLVKITKSIYKKTPVLTGVLISSFYFGIMHLTITQLFYSMIAGILFAFLVKITKSIYASILIHFVFNARQISLAYILSKNIPQGVQIYTPTNKESFILSLILFIKSLPFLLLSIFLFIKFIKSLPFLLLSIFLFIKFNKKEINDLIKENKAIKNSLEKPKVFTLFFFINIAIYLFFIILKFLSFNI